MSRDLFCFCFCPQTAGSQGEDLGEPRNHPLAVVESGSAVRPCESTLDPAGRAGGRRGGGAAVLPRCPRPWGCPPRLPLTLRPPAPLCALSPFDFSLLILSFRASLTLPCSQLPAEFGCGHKKRQGWPLRGRRGGLGVCVP